MKTLNVFYLSNKDYYSKTCSKMSTIYEVGTKQRLHWGMIQCHLRNGKVHIRPANKREIDWADKELSRIESKQG